MRSFCYSIAIFCLALAAVLAADVQSADRKIDGAESVLAIYPEDWGLSAKELVPGIILAIWPDGHIVWSKDRIKGGEPYLSARIEPELVSSILSEFERDGLFANKTLNQPRFGPDSFCTTLFVKSGKNQVKMQSWHEKGEAGGRNVATNHGLAPLGGKQRLAVLRDEPADYLHYRLVWSETRSKMLDLIPVDGKPVAGKPETTGRGLLWRETPDGERPVNEGARKKK